MYILKQIRKKKEKKTKTVIQENDRDAKKKRKKKTRHLMTDYTKNVVYYIILLLQCRGMELKIKISSVINY